MRTLTATTTRCGAECDWLMTLATLGLLLFLGFGLWLLDRRTR